MGWKFWQKNKGGENGAAHRRILPKPKELPQHMGMHLLLREQLDADFVWSLKCAMRLRENDKNLYDFRIFNESDAFNKGIRVTNYEALDEHADLILYHGHSDQYGEESHIEKYVTGKAA